MDFYKELSKKKIKKVFSEFAMMITQFLKGLEIEMAIAMEDGFFRMEIIMRESLRMVFNRAGEK